MALLTASWAFLLFVWEIILFSSTNLESWNEAVASIEGTGEKIT